MSASSTLLRRDLLPGRIRDRLLVLLFVVLLPILIVQAGIYARRFEAQRTQALQQNLEIAQATAVAFDGYIRDILRSELAIGTAIASLSPSEDWANQYLARNAAAYSSVREFSWFDRQGRVDASSNPAVVGVDASDRDYFQAIVGGQEWAVSDLLLARVGGEPVFTIARGIRDQAGAFQGAVVATVLPPRLGALALPIERAGGGAIIVVDRQGRLVYRRPEVELPWDERSPLPRHEPISQALGGRAATGTVMSAVDGQERTEAAVPVALIGWAVSASVPVSEATAPIVGDIVGELGLLVGVLAIAFAAALVIGRTISAPGSMLRERARLLAHGERIGRAEAAGPIELKELSEAFDTMAEQIQSRTTLLEAANRELEAFAYSVSHDLRAPLRHVDGFSQALLEDYSDRLDDQGKEYLHFIREGTQRMAQLIDALLKLSRATRGEMRSEQVDLSAMAQSITTELRRGHPDRKAEIVIAPGVVVNGDPRLLRIVLENLLGNAWKFTSQRSVAKVEFGATRRNGHPLYFVRDNGVGFDMAYVGKLFGAFQRLHRAEQFPGTGIGLATVQRIVHRHGGQIWAEGAMDQGATFYFTLGQ